MSILLTAVSGCNASSIIIWLNIANDRRNSRHQSRCEVGVRRYGGRRGAHRVGRQLSSRRRRRSRYQVMSAYVVKVQELGTLAAETENLRRIRHNILRQKLRKVNGTIVIIIIIIIALVLGAYGDLIRRRRRRQSSS